MYAGQVGRRVRGVVQAVGQARGHAGRGDDVERGGSRRQACAARRSGQRDGEQGLAGGLAGHVVSRWVNEAGARGPPPVPRRAGNLRRPPGCKPTDDPRIGECVAPTRTDPSLAPPGCEAFYVLAPVPHLGHAPLDWSSVGPTYRDRILSFLEEHYIPHLREDLVTVRIFTPQDFHNELHAHVGSAFSLEPLLTQSAFFRAHNRDDRIPNLYFVGAGTHPGAGLPGVVASAKATAELMLGDIA